MKAGSLLFAAALALAIAPVTGAQAQESSAAKAQKQMEELKSQQSVDRLRETRKNLQTAIERLETARDSSPAPTAGVTPQGAALQQAEQALLDVRRAIDELAVPQDQRQTVLDKLDDADSAMRMARRPDADSERQRLRAALEQVHREIEVAQETLPAPSPANVR
jgi:chromosome segregation ATPase